MLTGATSINRLVVYFLTPSGDVSWEERCAADAVYKLSRQLNPIETSSVSIGVHFWRPPRRQHLRVEPKGSE